jgi:hypothetical protein
MGIKLIGVVEGKRRIRHSPQEGDSFRKRRSGTAFWKACKECEEMLQNLGVPVVRATAEGEALCAILNQRGIVDGVISNDGDCLLFGATVVYTRFSIDNLDKGLVIKYEASNLRGLIDENNQEQDGGPPNDNDSATQHEPESTSTSVSLSREDLIAFALLTGSDLAGDGLPKVGHKKAIRFIRKCKENFPLNPDTAAIDELKSWARCAGGAASTNDKTKGRCCSNCSHPGDKRSHEKHGCEECGTEPGEPCLRVTTDDKFRDSLRAKALAMEPKFDATQVLNAYMSPNNNQVPASLVGEKARSICMGYPQLANMLQLSFIVKGMAMQASRDFIKQSMVRLLARRTLFDQTGEQTSKEKRGGRIRLSRERPVPIEISRRLVQNQVTCFEITWSVSATMTDNAGNGVDGYIFSTIEDKQLVETKYPDLVKTFLEAEKENEKQGDAEVQRRRNFVLKILDPRDAVAARNDQNARQHGRKRKNKRGDFFERKRARVDHHGTRRHDSGGDVRGTGEDAKKLILFGRMAAGKGGDMLVESIDDSDTVATEDSISTKEELPKKHRTIVGRPPRGRLAARMQLGVDKNDNAPIPSVIAIPERFPAKVKDPARKIPDESGAPQIPPSQERRHHKTRHLVKGTILPQKLFHGPSPREDSIEQLPALTPGNTHTVTCDMGILIPVTPLVRRRCLLARRR